MFSCISNGLRREAGVGCERRLPACPFCDVDVKSIARATTASVEHSRRPPHPIASRRARLFRDGVRVLVSCCPPCCPAGAVVVGRWGRWGCGGRSVRRGAGLRAVVLVRWRGGLAVLVTGRPGACGLGCGVPMAGDAGRWRAGAAVAGSMMASRSGGGKRCGRAGAVRLRDAAWRVSFPAGPHPLGRRWPSRSATGGAWLAMWRCGAIGVRRPQDRPR